MSHGLSVRGKTGRIKNGFRVAAVLGAYSLTPAGPLTWSVEATVVDSDAYWLSQGGADVLEVGVGKELWRWKGAALVVAGGQVVGTVTGRPERRRV